jgi:hypothetical protein
VSAAAADRRRARGVELAMETRSALLDARDADAREDNARQRARVFVGGLLDSLKAEEALDHLEDTKRERAIELVTELSGLLDGTAVESVAPIAEAAS